MFMLWAFQHTDRRCRGGATKGDEEDAAMDRNRTETQRLWHRESREREELLEGNSHHHWLLLLPRQGKGGYRRAHWGFATCIVLVIVI